MKLENERACPVLSISYETKNSKIRKRKGVIKNKILISTFTIAVCIACQKKKRKQQVCEIEEIHS
jgi:hypothetical protein